MFRNRYGMDQHFDITSENNFPTAAGIASSSSGFAALAIALNELCSLGLGAQDLSILARQGSGSATRSLYGGFAIWHKGTRSDGADSYGQQIYSATHWPALRMIIVVVSNVTKKVSSRDGMAISCVTSSHYPTWVASSEKRIAQCISAIDAKDLHLLGTIVEQEWYDWQKVLASSDPTLNYLTDDSHKVIQTVKQLNSSGIPCFFTTDAGPNVTILCLECDISRIINQITQDLGNLEIIISSLAGDPIIEPQILI